MAISTKNYDLTGNQMMNDGSTIIWDAQTNTNFAPGTAPLICSSSLATTPTFAAPKGSLCLSSAGTNGTSRAWINTNGSTTWTAITTSA